MSFQLIDQRIAPAEGEITVRTYHCTTISPVFGLIGLETNGYLTVTNKRMIYYSEGSSLFGVAGHSKLYKDVPLADVATISLKEGTRFSILRLLAAVFLGPIPAALLAFLFVVALGMLNTAPGGNSFYLLRIGLFLQMSAAALFVLLSLSIPRESILRSMVAACGLLLVAVIPAIMRLPAQGLPALGPIYRVPMLTLGVLLLIYWVWCVYWFFRKEYLMLAIRSKTNFPPIIQIAGVSWWGRINVAADLAYGMAPAVDANALFKEIGAVVTDIQTMGDFGVKKWQQPAVAAATESGAKGWSFFAFQRTSFRPALACFAALALLVGAESMWYLRNEKRMLATRMQSELAQVRDLAQRDSAARTWTPRLLAAAEREATAGEAAFAANQFTDAMAHWKVSLTTYRAIPGAADALKKASALQTQYKAKTGSTYLQESASERLKSAQLMKAFSVLIDQHPSPNEPWRDVRKRTTAARELDEDKWDLTGPEWVRAGSGVPKATQLMRADLWVKQAEAEIKKDNAAGAIAAAENALKELAGYPDAVQRRKLAVNMSEYGKWLQADVEEGAGGAAKPAEYIRQFEQFGGADWKMISGMVENARGIANRNEWDKCNEEWESIVSKMPGVVLAVRLGRCEVDARRGNWGTVAVLAGKILRDQPGHKRAAELKRKADGMEMARRAELAYVRAMATALDQEVAVERIKVGDMTDFIAHMDRYGREEWAQIKDAIAKAEAFSQNEQGAESLAEWTKVNGLFPAAVQRMRAEIWLEQAELAAKSNNWQRALVHAERALKEKPDHARARQLRDQADSTEEKRLRQSN